MVPPFSLGIYLSLRICVHMVQLLICWFFFFFFNLQGIDLKRGGKSKKTKRTAPKSDDIYLKLLVKVSFQKPMSTFL